MANLYFPFRHHYFTRQNLTPLDKAKEILRDWFFGVKDEIITINSNSATKISDETGKSTCSVIFTANLDIAGWEARASYESQTPGPGVGLVVGSGGAISAGGTGTFDVTYDELTFGDRTYDISVYEVQDTATYLYNLGDKCTAITGGFTKVYIYGSGGLYVEEAQDIYYGDNSATEYSNMGVRSTNMIDLTNYTKLCCDLELVYSYCNGNGNSFIVGAGLTSTGAFAASCGLDGYATSAARAVYSVDISALNGNYYVAGRSSSGNYPDEQCYGKIYKIWLE